jgi:hypothetical protein
MLRITHTTPKIAGQTNEECIHYISTHCDSILCGYENILQQRGAFLGVSDCIYCDVISRLVNIFMVGHAAVGEMIIAALR